MCKKRRREIQAWHMANNEQFVLARRIRNITRKVWKYYSPKVNNYNHIIDCHTIEFREYIRAMFKRGMNINNYGTYWELDHIEPLILFDLTCEREHLQAAHYTNVRPMRVYDNRRRPKFEFDNNL